MYIKLSEDYLKEKLGVPTHLGISHVDYDEYLQEYTFVLEEEDELSKDTMNTIKRGLE